jgi:two-component system, OmpR family, sensor kinase
MSLRTRLTILYTSLVGGILLLFGLTVYQTISIILMDQIDEALFNTASDVFAVYEQNPTGQVGIVDAPGYEPPANVYIQYWSRNAVLWDAWPRDFRRALDPLNIQTVRPVYRSVYHPIGHLRVLTVPVLVGTRLLGTIQVATGLALIDTTQRVLLFVLLFGVVISMSLAAIAAWFSTHQVLVPLETVTQTALQITRADDLSRRINSQGLSENDEIGQLIAAFNLTLGRLEQLFHTQRRFLTDVGHELRTPLTVIKGNVSLMRRMECAEEDMLDSIEDEADRLTRLAGDLLFLSQAESGKLPLDWRKVELDELVLDVIQQMRVLARGQIQLRIGDFDQVHVCGDRDRLKQVLVNLISNAVRYTPAGGEVIVNLGKTEYEAFVTVEDTGPGISPEDLPHIFERFYRGEKSRTRARDGQGFGLGLSIAYWIVRNHHGRISVDSELGRGTRFDVMLPLPDGDCNNNIKV